MAAAASSLSQAARLTSGGGDTGDRGAGALRRAAAARSPARCQPRLGTWSWHGTAPERARPPPLEQVCTALAGKLAEDAVDDVQTGDDGNDLQLDPAIGIVPSIIHHLTDWSVEQRRSSIATR